MAERLFPGVVLRASIHYLPLVVGRARAGARARGGRPVSGARRAGGYRPSRLCSGSIQG
jgi:hypothetical protein